MEYQQQRQESDRYGSAAFELPETPEAYTQRSMYGIYAAAHSKGNLRTTLQPLSGSESESDSEGNKGSNKEAERTVSETSREKSTMAEKQGKASSRTEAPKLRILYFPRNDGIATKSCVEACAYHQHEFYVSPPVLNEDIAEGDEVIVIDEREATFNI
ncbi:hypothetical protein LTR37_017217 [Vermiconidia calcicola]|uniref:Uncharacterized protein n=1 Tax=Vermiconidia calcicola TaxID=1690605 RepID=A0ACC3MKR7_9PEZI|nr:hypothetical protein LTR37_017217 [Vermiconidia calcicola]